ncbi:unnamed protein product [Amoebophrya sp. A120]|nr:unnamed protein product [Amoebophrya sp. A120]|eukprot:GSA120T00014547001.1
MFSLFIVATQDFITGADFSLAQQILLLPNKGRSTTSFIKMSGNQLEPFQLFDSSIEKNPKLLAVTFITMVLTVWVIHKKSRPTSATSTAPAGPARFYERLANALMLRGGGQIQQKKHRTAAEIMRGKHKIDVKERGGNGDAVDYRLWMQLLVYDLHGASTPDHFTAANQLSSEETLRQFHLILTSKKIPHVLYSHIYHPTQVGLLFWSQDPSYFVKHVNPLLQHGDTKARLLHTMFGKTYSNGHEQDLDYALLQKPVKMAMKKEHEYCIWYPLRRCGKFYLEEPEAQCEMLLEHALIGRSYGEKNLAHDIRLQATGLDEKDNEFVIGLVGKQLHPLAKVIQDMRKTRHTSEFIESLGPFFVGLKAFQWPPALDESFGASVPLQQSAFGVHQTGVEQQAGPTAEQTLNEAEAVDSNVPAGFGTPVRMRVPPPPVSVSATKGTKDGEEEVDETSAAGGSSSSDNNEAATSAGTSTAGGNSSVANRRPCPSSTSEKDDPPSEKEEIKPTGGGCPFAAKARARRAAEAAAKQAKEEEEKEKSITEETLKKIKNAFVTEK